MTREQVLARLLEHKTELQSLGLAHLRLFGSVARAESTVLSDVDLIAEFDPEFSLTSISLGRAQTRLERLLGCSVDLATDEDVTAIEHMLMAIQRIEEFVVGIDFVG
jgi:predicted nucleotidyltransferase